VKMRESNSQIAGTQERELSFQRLAGVSHS
jgi:hypothetical protein